MKDKAQLIQLIVGIVSLVALLAYTLAHTGALLAQYVQLPLIGYVAALGIELSIVSLSLRIGELRKTRQSAGFFYFVLVSVVIVSAVANVAEGFHVAYNERLTLSSVGKLDLLQAAIGVTATGLISLIVLALSEIFGTDVSHTVKAMSLAEFDGKHTPKGTPEWQTLRRLVWERDNKSCLDCEKDLSTGSFHCHHVVPEYDGGTGEPDNLITLCPECHGKRHGPTLVKAFEAKRTAQQERRDKVLDLLQAGQQAKDIAGALNVSIKTIRRDIEALNGNVRVTQ